MISNWEKSFGLHGLYWSISALYGLIIRYIVFFFQQEICCVTQAVNLDLWHVFGWDG